MSGYSSSSPSDPWAGESVYESADYDPENPKVWIASSDKMGHKSTLSFGFPGGGRTTLNVPDGMPGEIAAIVGHVKEFRTSQDFLRDILARGISYWRKRVKTLEDSDWGRMVMMKIAFDDIGERLAFEQDLVGQIEKLVFSSANSPMMQQETLIRAREAMLLIRDESVKQRIQGLLQQHQIFTSEISPSDFQ